MKCGIEYNHFNVPLDPKALPEFEYKSKGFVGDLIFKKRKTQELTEKLEQVLEKYYKFKYPYFVNFVHMAGLKEDNNSIDSSKTYTDLEIFKSVLKNLDFYELDEFPQLAEKLIRITYFTFLYEEFARKIEIHVKPTLYETLRSWVEEQGDLFRYYIRFLVNYLNEKGKFIDEVMIKNVTFDDRLKDPTLLEGSNTGEQISNRLLAECEVIYFDVLTQRYQAALEKFDPEKYITIHHVDAMDGYEFEEFLADLYRGLGFSVKTTPKGRDQGADLFIESFGTKTVVQAKNYISNIGNSAIQEVISAKAFYACHQAMVVTNRFFTHSAKELAESADIKLVDREELQKMISDYNRIIIQNMEESLSTKVA